MVARLLLFLLAIAGAVGSALGLAASAYRSAGDHWRPLDLNAARSAYQFSYRLAPWSVPTSRRQAQAALAAGQPRTAVDLSLRALRLSPADGDLWDMHARKLTRIGVFDARLTQSVRAARTLEPQSRRIAVAQSLLGARHWPRAEPELRALWSNGLNLALAHHWELTTNAARNELEFGLCAMAGLRLRQWCADAIWMRRMCNEPRPTAQRQRYCERRGFMTRD